MQELLDLACEVNWWRDSALRKQNTIDTRLNLEFELYADSRAEVCSLSFLAFIFTEVVFHLWPVFLSEAVMLTQEGNAPTAATLSVPLAWPWRIPLPQESQK